MPDIDNSGEEEIIQDSQSDEITPPAEAEEATEEDHKVTRYKEQLKGRELQAKKAEEKAERLETLLIKNLVTKVESDNSYLIELYDDDPSIAEKVANHFGGISAKDAIRKIKEAQAEQSGIPYIPPVDEDELFAKWEARWEAKQRAKEASSKTQQFFSNLSGEEKEMAIAKFETLKGGKDLDADELQELAELAIYAVTKNERKKKEKDEAILNLSSTTLGSTTSERPKPKKKVAGADELAKSMGLGYLYE